MANDDPARAGTPPGPAAEPSAVPSAAAPLVSLEGIVKAFPGTLAVDRVDLALDEGAIHALLGENGAGKSTLVKVLYGLLQADAGRILWRGRPVSIEGPARARELGVAMVFQHFSLFDALTVTENVALGIGVDADAALARRIEEVSARYGLPLDPARSVWTLSVGERQRIEICRCLLQEPRLLVMDEPTSVLTPDEADVLFATLRRLAAEGVAILYISHKLDEIRRLCDAATVLRGGRVVATADPRNESAASLAALMMGSPEGGAATGAGTRADGAPDGVSDGAIARDAVEAGAQGGGAAARASGAPVRLRLVGLALPPATVDAVALEGIELEVAAGEIVGVAGVAGNGQDELVAALSGEALVPEAAMVSIDGRAVGTEGVVRRRALGLATVPEQRLGHAAVPTMTLAENAFLTGYRRAGLLAGGLLAPGRSRRLAARVIEEFDVRCNGPSSLAGSLSGGNLQKFVVGREVVQGPSTLVVAQPTWGVDAGAAAVIRAALRRLADEGAAVLVVSQDLDELMEITDRIGALCAGRLSATYPTASVDAHAVGRLMGGAASLDAPADPSSDPSPDATSGGALAA